jgi:hypothetical protein
MATKTAVWHFTNPDVVYIGTSFLTASKGDVNSPEGIKQRQFVALMKRLIADASAFAASGDPLSPTTDFAISIGTGFSAPPPAETGYYFEGPYRVSSSGNVVSYDKVFIDLEDKNKSVSDITIVKADGTPFPLDFQRYGGDSSDLGVGVALDEEFFLKIPDTHTDLNGIKGNTD